MTLTPVVSAQPPSFGVGDTFSFIEINNDQNRTLYAKTTYDVQGSKILLVLGEILNQLRTVPNDDGFIVIDNTNAVEGNFQSIQVIEPCKIANIIADNSTVGNLSAYELPQSFEIRGQFSSIQLEYGAVIAYKTLDTVGYINGIQSVFDGKILIDINNGEAINPI
jgi:hypothetical protein